MTNDALPFLSELAWEFMTPMEQALWGTTVALNTQDPDGGLGAADAAIVKLRSVSGVRSRRPEPEDEAARVGDHIEFEDFAIWYLIEYRNRHCFDQDYKAPTQEQTKEAYERFFKGRDGFY